MVLFLRRCRRIILSNHVVGKRSILCVMNCPCADDELGSLARLLFYGLKRGLLGVFFVDCSQVLQMI